MRRRRIGWTAMHAELAQGPAAATPPPPSGHGKFGFGPAVPGAVSISVNAPGTAQLQPPCPTAPARIGVSQLDRGNAIIVGGSRRCSLSSMASDRGDTPRRAGFAEVTIASDRRDGRERRVADLELQSVLAFLNLGIPHLAPATRIKHIRTRVRGEERQTAFGRFLHASSARRLGRRRWFVAFWRRR